MIRFYSTLVLLLSVFISAQSQEQITNFHAQAGEQGSTPGYFSELNGKLLFWAFSEQTGQELWVKDSPGAAARPLADINVGPGGSMATWDWKGGAVMDGYLYFAANDGKTGDQIWRTDGGAHTEQVTDVLNGYVSALTAVGHTLFFGTKSGQTQTFKLWKTDGTKAGTVNIKDIAENINSNSPLFATACNGLYFFGLTDQGYSSTFKVWRSDGTSDGTYATTQEISYIGSTALMPFVTLNDAVYIIGRGPDFLSPEFGLLKITGDPGQTEPVQLMGPVYNTDFEFGDSKVFHDEAYFFLYDLSHHRQVIWKTDGSTAGTVNLYEDVAAHYYTPTAFFEYDDALLFTTANANNGTSLARIAGGSAVVEPLVEISQNEWPADYFIPGIQEGHITKSGDNYVVYLTNDVFYATVAYVTDLTAPNTKRAPDLDNVREMFPYQDQVYLSQGPAWQLSVVNESATGSTVLQNLGTFIKGMDNTRVEVIQDNVFFDGDDGTGKKLWMYHDDASPIVNVDKNPQGLTVIDDQLYYAADGVAVASDLRRTSGSTSTLITPKDADQAATTFDNFTKFNNTLYFTALSTKTNSLFLGKIEGDTYTLVADLGGSFYYYTNNFGRLRVAGNKMFAVTAYYPLTIWVTDGTTPGTTKVKTFDYFFTPESTVANSLLFYIVTNSMNTTDELWVSDGTVANTKLIREFSATTQSEYHHITSLGSNVIFVANTSENGREVWQSDGTIAGTVLLKDIWPGPSSGAATTEFTPFGNKLYFSATSGISNGVYQSGLWATDGTAGGTTLIKDDHTHGGGFFPKYLAVAGDTLYFQANDAEHGSELWKTDGTTAHTTLAADVASGAANSSPKNFRLHGNDLVFAASVSGEGDQLWKMNVIPVPPVTAAENPSTSYLAVYPNPTDGIIRFQANNITGLRAIKLIDLQGRTVARPSMQDGDTIQASQLPAGIYILTAETSQGQYRTKVIKQ